MAHSRPTAPPSDNSSPPVDARARICGAAFRLFAEKGYSYTSVQDIADAAAVKKSILYYYFGSKEGLYQTLFSEAAGNLRGFLVQSLSAVGFACTANAAVTDNVCAAELPAGSSCQTLLGALVETMTALARDNREPVRFFMSHIFASDTDRPHADIEEMEHVLPQFFRQIVGHGLARGELRGNPADLERLLLGALQYSIIRHLRRPEQEPLPPGLGRQLVEAVLSGFSAAVAPPLAVKAKSKTRAARRPAADPVK
jgi:AcrR family transcriptional regulator